MEQLNIILFESCFGIVIIALIIMLIKAIKRNKIGVLLPFILIIGIGTTCFGIWLKVQQNSQANTSIANNSNNTNTIVANSSTGTNQIKDVTFDANGSVIPKTYGYSKDDILGKIHITTGIEAVSNETSSNSKSIPSNDKEETYDKGSKNVISLTDFSY